MTRLQHEVMPLFFVGWGGSDVNKKNRLPKPYHTRIWRAIYEFELIEPDDRILVGLSGGKDSFFLTYVLKVLQSYSAIPFTFETATVDLGFPDPLDTGRIEEQCAQMGINSHMISTRIADVIEERRESESPCSVCSYFRRAALHRYASEQGFNKVAFAHHQDDALETFLMNILYSGRVYALPWKTHLSRTGITVIRPMMYLAEKDVIKGFKRTGLEVVEHLCPYSKDTMRARVKRLIAELTQENRRVRPNLAAAIRDGDHVELWPPIARRNRS
jgi:tRNA 2-thiocytidine biosynthesis protein TtcA